MARRGWTRTLTGKPVAPHQTDAAALRAERQRMEAHAARTAQAKPMTEEELRALVDSFPKDRIKRCETGDAPGQDIAFGYGARLRPSAR